MIQRIQTFFWLLSICLILGYLFQIFDVEMDLRNYHQPTLSAMSVISILLLIATIFLFTRRRLQHYLSNISAFVLLGQIGFLIMSHLLNPLDYIVTFILIGLAVMFNFIGSYFIAQDIRLMENSSRLR